MIQTMICDELLTGSGEYYQPHPLPTARVPDTADERFAELIDELREEMGIEDWEVLALHLHRFTTGTRPISRLLRFAIDVAGDEYLADEFYERYPQLGDFLAIAGCSDEEVQFRSYLRAHPDMLYCRTDSCRSTLYGACPIMTCSVCGRRHYLDVDGLSAKMCSTCVARHLGECTEETTTRMTHIYAIRREHGLLS